MVSQPKMSPLAVTRRNSLREAVLAVFFLLSFSILKFFPMLAILRRVGLLLFSFFNYELCWRASGEGDADYQI